MKGSGGVLAVRETAPGLPEVQQRLRRMVLEAVPSAQPRRSYGKALDDLFAFSVGRSPANS